MIRFSLPAGSIAAFSAWVVYIQSRDWAGADISVRELAEARTAAPITLLLIGLVVLVVVSRPLRMWKIGLAFAMAGLQACILALPFTRNYFALEWVDGRTWGCITIVVAIATLLIAVIPYLVPGILPPKESEETSRSMGVGSLG